MEKDRSVDYEKAYRKLLETVEQIRDFLPPKRAKERGVFGTLVERTARSHPGRVLLVGAAILFLGFVAKDVMRESKKEKISGLESSMSELRIRQEVQRRAVGKDVVGTADDSLQTEIEKDKRQVDELKGSYRFWSWASVVLFTLGLFAAFLSHFYRFDSVDGG